MDWPAIIAEIGGGLPAVVIVALGWLYWNSQRRVNEIQDARLNDVREHGRELREVSDNATAAINGIARIVEDRRGG
jgi:hypothetical protein